MHFRTKFFVLICFFLLLAQCADEHEHEEDEELEHDHEEHGWEWAGAFALHPEHEHTWVVNKVNGSYAADHMLMLILTTTTADSQGIQDAASSAQEIWQAGEEPIIVSPLTNATITPGAVHLLEFNVEAFASLFQIKLPSTQTARSEASNNVVIFTEHNPAEFEGNIHYLIDSEGNDVEPGATDPESEEEETVERQAPIGEAIGAAFCVAIASFIGVVVLVPGFAWMASRFSILSAIDAFASGALLALIVFIMVPESLATISSAYPIETQTAAWFGSSVLIGFVVPILLDWFTALIFPNAGHGHGHAAFTSPPEKHVKTEVSVQSSNEEQERAPLTYPEYNSELQADSSFPTPVSTPVPESGGSQVLNILSDDEKQAPSSQKKTSVWRSFFHCCPLTGVAWSITIGDGLHNFTDGVLIGVGFKLCGSSMGWSIAGASVVHELASELSEFWLLVNPDQGKLSWLQAIALNFCTSLTVVIGCLMVSYIEITSFTLGLLLGFGAGLLLCIATVSIWSRILERDVSLNFVLMMAFFFTFGAVAIGLVLLSHLHCEAEGGHGGHEGHAH